MERENLWGKDIETIEKLFAETEEGFIPRCVIGIQNIKNEYRIQILNDLVEQKNRNQKSEVLMIYRYYDEAFDFDRVCACFFNENGLVETRKAISSTDQSDYWFMIFEEKYRGAKLR